MAQALDTPPEPLGSSAPTAQHSPRTRAGCMGDASAAQYRAMRQALQFYESGAGMAAAAAAAAPGVGGQQGAPPARVRAFFATLRQSLTVCIAETDAALRDMRLAAAHAWFLAHRPRLQAAEADMAAALAGSLSIATPGSSGVGEQGGSAGSSGMLGESLVRLAPGKLAATSAALTAAAKMQRALRARSSTADPALDDTLPAAGLAAG